MYMSLFAGKTGHIAFRLPGFRNHLVNADRCCFRASRTLAENSIFDSKIRKMEVKNVDQQQLRSTLPEPYGTLTNRIRKLYAIDLLSHIIKVMTKRSHHDYTCDVYRLMSGKDKKLVELLWGSLLQFYQCYDMFFQLSKSKEFVRAKISPDFKLDEASVLSALDDLIPEKGSIKEEYFAALLHQSAPNVVHDVILSSDEISAKYVAAKNKDGVYYIRRVSDAAFFDSWCPLAGNKPVAYCLEAAAFLLPALPDFWIPYEECLACTQDPELVNHRNFFRIADILDNGIEKAEFKFRGVLFARRNQSLKKYTDAPSCVVADNFRGYEITPLRAVQIAFCLPSAPVDPLVAQGRMFPSVIEWAANTPYSLPEIVMMYPEVMAKTESGLVSLVRSTYPELAPADGEESQPAAEEKFMHALNQNTAAKHELLQLVGEPSSDMFVDARSFYDKTFYKVKERLAKEKAIQDHARFSDKAILEEAVQYVTDVGLPVNDLVRKITAGLSGEKRKNFICTICLVHQSKMDRLVEKYPEYNLVAYEERIEGSAKYAYYIAKKTDHITEGNPFLEPERLQEEIAYHFRARSEMGDSTKMDVPAFFAKRAEISSLIGGLPKKARTALKHFGGFVDFMNKYPGNMIVDGGFLRLKF